MAEAMTMPVHEGQYAGFWVRFFAACIDLLIFAPIYMLLKNFEPGALHASGSGDESMDFMTQIIPSTPYQWAFEASFDILSLVVYAWFLCSRLQGSPGMFLFKFHITDKMGQRITFLRSFMWCATSVLAWVICAAGLLYMEKDIFIVTDMLVSCRDQNVDMLDCVTEIEKAIGIPYANFLQLTYAAAGMFFFMYIIWALSIALPKDKTGFHNLVCGTRFVKGRVGREA